MTFIPSKSLLAAIGIVAGVMLALPASAEPAKSEKPKKPEATEVAKPARTSSRSADKFRGGPLYNGRDYLGDDPDPFIRMMIQRDLTARYGGND